MKQLDRDLLSIQEVRNLIGTAKEAQKKLAAFSQEKIDHIILAMSKAGMEHSEELAKMANEDTGFGIVSDKIIKNQTASQKVYEHISGKTLVGILNEDKDRRIIEIGVPMGVIAGLIPSTNPTSTVIYKALIAVKAGNAIVFSPHPSAQRCIMEATRVMDEAAQSAGCPAGIISCIDVLTMAATNELMRHPDTALILATGGSDMVKAAYSSGNPAIGVGPGNNPTFIEKTANIPVAVERILRSKCFDNGTICASEQSIVTEEAIKEDVIAELKKQGAYFLNDEEKQKIAAILMRTGGTMNPAIVGKNAKHVANMAGIQVPEDTRVLVGYETEVGKNHPFSKEKLCPVLAFYVEKNGEDARNRCIEILEFEGIGHTMAIHSEDEAMIREFALKIPVYRLLVNTPSALGAIGATTNLVPAFTLGCGTVGGSSTSDNIGPEHLINIRRVAYGIE